jgi:hypothetical protein
MATPLGRFLAELATDPSKYEAFIRDRDAVVQAADLSAAEQRALKSGDAAVIQAQLAGSESDDRAATDSNCHTIYWAASIPSARA